MLLLGVKVAVTSYVPAAKGVEGVKVALPLASTVTVPVIGVLPSASLVTVKATVPAGAVVCPLVAAQEIELLTVAVKVMLVPATRGLPGAATVILVGAALTVSETPVEVAAAVVALGGKYSAVMECVPTVRVSVM